MQCVLHNQSSLYVIVCVVFETEILDKDEVRRSAQRGLFVRARRIGRRRSDLLGGAGNSYLESGSIPMELVGGGQTFWEVQGIVF